eukprot:m.107287 g.107287  ORF g.107287 m.107287 type:complete len:526 (-) comp27780_c0_seq3:345-1922(-)
MCIQQQPTVMSGLFYLVCTPSLQTTMMLGVLLGLVPVIIMWDPDSGDLPDAPDCECKESWTNTNGQCNPSSHENGGGAKQMFRCPSLALLSECDAVTASTQSWCETKTPICKQQSTMDLYNQSRSYCNPITQQPELPKCTCKKNWIINSGGCSNVSLLLSGCQNPSATQKCFNSTNTRSQSWCKTNEVNCLQQEDEIIDGETTEVMKGKGWSYCNLKSGKATLPHCKCQTSWNATCSDEQTTTFNLCPSTDAQQHCGSSISTHSGQTWCRTTRGRCLEQTYHGDNLILDMRNHSWAICDSKSDSCKWPSCECKQQWKVEEDRCEKHPFTVKGCPLKSDLVKCDPDVTQSFCDTTFETCTLQNHASTGEGWAYCDEKTQQAEMGECECRDLWKYRMGSCNVAPVMMRGCPQLSELQACDETISSSWCHTKDQTCKGQVEENRNEGWVYCDANTQRPILQHKEDMAGSVAIAVVVTLLVSLAMVGLFRVYRNLRGNTHQNGDFELVTGNLLPEATDYTDDNDEDDDV